MIEIIDEITSYVDNELEDQLLINRVKSLIEQNYLVKQEYLRQVFIKELLKNRLSKSRAPEYLIANIRKKIKTVLILPEK